MDAINPRFQKKRPASIAPDQLVAELRQGSRAALSQALTLVESRLPAHREKAEAVVEAALPHTGKSLRVGITGVPGVGKSTFIESFGEYLIERQDKRLAVLAIDPSSARTRGSILGDKTRMEKLAQNERAFIRPSPAAGSLGGTARKTRESILLCEAAGYDLVMVETVGVGQSETAVKSMVDFFMLLMLATAGDELQGIKRGIMEMADLLVINKADDPEDRAVRMAVGEYKRALHLFPPNPNEWIPQVKAASGLKGTGLEAVWESMEAFENQQRLKGYLAENRAQQAEQWLEQSFEQLLLEEVESRPAFRKRYAELRARVRAGEKAPSRAARELVKLVSPSVSGPS